MGIDGALSAIGSITSGALSYAGARQANRANKKIAR